VHHDAPQRRVADEEAGVRKQRSVEPVKKFRGRRPVPRHTNFQRFEGHTLDPAQHLHQVRTIFRGKWGDREPAVSAKHRRHAVQRRRAQRGVPEGLRVIVSVDVDKPRTHDLAMGIERPVS
jgi:hypothetical protein